ncbi:hypothetical protein T281_14035 [Rhodomicrobium udaipurense JA643]|nr:hypothetical protein T281_14035 [Rhodomicrobium udaipurense JA643]
MKQASHRLALKWDRSAAGLDMIFKRDAFLHVMVIVACEAVPVQYMAITITSAENFTFCVPVAAGSRTM